MKIKIRYFFTCIFCAALSMVIQSTAQAQLTDTTNSGQRGAPRIYKYSARTGAMADATVADANNLSVVNINPAGLGLVKDLSEAQINIAQNWNNNLMLENFTLPAVRAGTHSFALQFAVHHDRGFETLNLLGRNSLPQPKITMVQLDIAYALTIKNVLSLGIFNNISYAENSIAYYWTFNPTFGVLYAPSEAISYGIAFRGLGRSPTYMVHSLSTTTLGSQHLPRSLELGATLNYPTEMRKKPYFSISMANEKRFGEDGLWYKVGIEIKRIPYLAFRSGLLYQSATNTYAPRFGMGITSNVIEIDYTVSHSQDLFERYHQLGITIHF